MKPRIFIGSSGNSRNFGEAIHARLEDIAECTVWTAGAFALSTSTLAGLLENLRDSDFGIFVFGPDDDAVVKGKLLKVPRDNVVYEAGLFSGYVGPERCFIAAPKSVEVHIPTDLAGMTLGFYDDQRIDGNDDAAVLTFSNQVKKQVRKAGLFTLASNEELRDLVIRFECCDWIPQDKSNTGDSYAERKRRKKQVFAEIDAFCESHRLNKHRLLAKNSAGHSMILLGAIIKHPEGGDCDLMQQINAAHVGPGVALNRLLDAAEAIKTTKCCTYEQLETLSYWLKQLPNVDATITDRIAKLAEP